MYVTKGILSLNHIYNDAFELFMCEYVNDMLPEYESLRVIGRIRLPVSTASRTYELSGETHVTPFRTYRLHSTGLCNYKP